MRSGAYAVKSLTRSVESRRRQVYPESSLIYSSVEMAINSDTSDRSRLALRAARVGVGAEAEAEAAAVAAALSRDPALSVRVVGTAESRGTRDHDAVTFAPLGLRCPRRAKLHFVLDRSICTSQYISNNPYSALYRYIATGGKNYERHICAYFLIVLSQLHF